MKQKLLGAVKIGPKTTTGSIEQVLSKHKMFKKASMFSEKGVGYNTDTDVEGKKPMPEDRSALKLNPALAALIGGTTGGIGNSIYGGMKDVQNQEYTGLNKMDQIDPGKFSWDRADFHADRSASQHLNMQTLKDGLKGLLMGGLGGAAIGGGIRAMESGLNSGDIGTDALTGGLIGGVGGLIGGNAVGSYRGANNYNSRVIDKL